MKRVLFVHGYTGSPNSAWIPWVMGELKQKDAYACSLMMPSPDEPVLSEWLAEIVRAVAVFPNDEVILVGHSLGVAAILNYAQSASVSGKISGAVLVAGRCIKSTNPKTAGFYPEFDFAKIKSSLRNCVVIHGDDDDVVPVENGKKLSQELSAQLVLVNKGKHLTASQGWTKLPQCLEAIAEML